MSLLLSRGELSWQLGPTEEDGESPSPIWFTASCTALNSLTPQAIKEAAPARGDLGDLCPHQGRCPKSCLCLRGEAMGDSRSPRQQSEVSFRG